MSQHAFAYVAKSSLPCRRACRHTSHTGDSSYAARQCSSIIKMERMQVAPILLKNMVFLLATNLIASNLSAEMVCIELPEAKSWPTVLVDKHEAGRKQYFQAPSKTAAPVQTLFWIIWRSGDAADSIEGRQQDFSYFNRRGSLSWMLSKTS